MRWKANRKYKVGDSRIVSRFFFFPQRFGPVWIWLEWGLVSQTRVESYIYVTGCCAVPNDVWQDEALINKTPKPDG